MVAGFFHSHGEKADFHRPHPGKEAKRYQVRNASDFLTRTGVTHEHAKHKGYTAKLNSTPMMKFSSQHHRHPRYVGFHGQSVEELKAAFREAVDFYLESCEKAGRKPNKPFSGQFVVRVDSSLHGEIAAAAAKAGKSLNKWVADTLDQTVHAS